MRCHAQKHLSFVQRLANQTKGSVLEITQAAMDQFARRRGCARTKIVHLDEQYLDSAAGCVTGEARSVYAATDDGEVKIGHCLMIRFIPQNEWLEPSTQGQSVLTLGLRGVHRN
jgi:hypothetical protein